MSDIDSSVGSPDPTGCMMTNSADELSDIEIQSRDIGVTTRSKSKDRSRSAPASRPSSRGATPRSPSRSRKPRAKSRNDQADPFFRPLSPNNISKSLGRLNKPPQTPTKIRPRTRSADRVSNLNRTPRKLDFTMPGDPRLPPQSPTDSHDFSSEEDNSVLLPDPKEEELRQVKTLLTELEKKHKEMTTDAHEFERQAGQTKLDNNRFKHAYKSLQLQFRDESERFDDIFHKLSDQNRAYEEQIIELEARSDKGRQDKIKMDKILSDLKTTIAVKNAHIDEAAILTTTQIDTVEDLAQQVKQYEVKAKGWHKQRTHLEKEIETRLAIKSEAHQERQAYLRAKYARQKEEELRLKVLIRDLEKRLHYQDEQQQLIEELELQVAQKRDSKERSSRATMTDLDRTPRITTPKKRLFPSDTPEDDRQTTPENPHFSRVLASDTDPSMIPATSPSSRWPMSASNNSDQYHAQGYQNDNRQTRGHNRQNYNKHPDKRGSNSSDDGSSGPNNRDRYNDRHPRSKGNDNPNPRRKQKQHPDADNDDDQPWFNNSRFNSVYPDNSWYTRPNQHHNSPPQHGNQHQMSSAQAQQPYYQTPPPHGTQPPPMGTPPTIQQNPYQPPFNQPQGPMYIKQEMDQYQHYNRSGPRLKINECMPKRFDGIHKKDPVAHMASVNDYFKIQGLTDDEEKIDRFKLTLEEAPRRWVDSITPTTMAECAHAFIKQYSGMISYEANLNNFRSLKWKESEDIENYRQALATLSEGIGNLYEKDSTGMPTKALSKEFICQFLLGLPDEYQLTLSDLTEESTLPTIIRRIEKLKSLRRLKGTTTTQSKAAVSFDTILKATNTSSGNTDNMTQVVNDAVEQAIQKAFLASDKDNSRSYSKDRSNSYNKQPYNNDKRRDSYNQTSRGRYDPRYAHKEYPGSSPPKDYPRSNYSSRDRNNSAKRYPSGDRYNSNNRFHSRDRNHSAG